MVSEIRFFSKSTDNTFTVTTSPTFNTSDGCLIYLSQKLQSIKVRLDEDKLIITAKSDSNTRLEHWAFEKCSAFFQEVFGVQPILTVKSSLI